MEGWKLTEGCITNYQITEEQIWSCFNYIFSTKSKNVSSYKFGLIRALVDNLYNADTEFVLTYDQIYETFSRIYWNLIIKYNLVQTDPSHKQTAIERICKEMQQKYQIPSGWAFDKLQIEIQNEALGQIKNEGKKYVVGAIYGDTRGLFYEFSTKKEYLKINPLVYNFLQHYQQVITRLNNYEWAKFLEKNNQVPGGFIQSIECITQRSSLDFYLKILEQYTPNQCFYCSKDLTPRTTHVDHFIPWSYIHSDNLWNLVLSCRDCNLHKSDHLPSEEYLKLLFERNRKLKTVEAKLVKEEIALYEEKKVWELFQYAEGNGFEGDWKTVIL